MAREELLKSIANLSFDLNEIIKMPKVKRNHYKINTASTCDQCAKEPSNKILWQDKYRYLWCTDCWHKAYK